MNMFIEGTNVMAVSQAFSILIQNPFSLLIIVDEAFKELFQILKYPDLFVLPSEFPCRSRLRPTIWLT